MNVAELMASGVTNPQQDVTIEGILKASSDVDHWILGSTFALEEPLEKCLLIKRPSLKEDIDLITRDVRSPINQLLIYRQPSLPKKYTSSEIPQGFYHLCQTYIRGQIAEGGESLFKFEISNIKEIHLVHRYYECFFGYSVDAIEARISAIQAQDVSVEQIFDVGFIDNTVKIKGWLMGNQQGAFVYPQSESRPTDPYIKVGLEETLFYDFVHRPKTTDFAGKSQRDQVSFLYRLPIYIIGTLSENLQQNKREFYLHSLRSLIMLPTAKQPYIHQWNLSKQSDK